MNFKTIILAAGLFLLSLNSCTKKDIATIPDTIADIQAAEDNAYAEEIFMEIYKAVRGCYFSSNNFGPFGGHSGNYTGPQILTIDFRQGLTCSDGRYRTGRIIAYWNGSNAFYANDTLPVITISLDNYTVNNDIVTGSMTITNLGRNANGNLHSSVVIDSANIITSTGTIIWKSMYDKECLSGYSTPEDPTDDTYSLTGSASGKTKNNLTFTATVVKPLMETLFCHWIEAGSFEIKTGATNSSGTFDYGTGRCDNGAVFKVNQRDYDITLK